jgi:hypothetical protein
MKGWISKKMAILTMFLPLLTLLSVANHVTALVWNEGLTITLRDVPLQERASKTCQLTALGNGEDDTDNVSPDLSFVITLITCLLKVLTAISECGNGGTTVFESGNFNITRWVYLSAPKH